LRGEAKALGKKGTVSLIGGMKREKFDGQKAVPFMGKGGRLLGGGATGVVQCGYSGIEKGVNIDRASSRGGK